MSLRSYRSKRRFEVTPEPRGRAGSRRGGRRFVVQKHAARRLHHDLRLELDGVLVSWAVPNGAPSEPGERALAVRTEDHPLEYATFEGLIPRGEYGGGTVMLWDRGTWRADGDAHHGLAAGRLDLELEGERLRGRWTLTRMRGGDGDGDGDGSDAGRHWLLVKRSDQRADARAEPAALDRSVATGRSMDEIARDGGHGKRRGRATGVGKRRGRRTRRAARELALEGSVSRHGERRAPHEVAGVRLSNPERVLYPEQGVTKRELAEYHEAVADALLPHVRDRPLTLVRCPRGREEHCFHQKHATGGLGDPVRAIPVDERDGEEALYVGVDDLAGLVTLVQNGALELHPWGARADRLDRPDRLVIDLDPGPDVAWERVVAAARALRELLDALGLPAFARTTGGKGLHVVLPIARRTGWDEAKRFTRDLAEALARRDRGGYVLVATKSRRAGRIFIDYLRNARGATAIASYSPRARPGAPVATPVHWDEVTPRLDPSAFTVRSVPRRLARQRRDPWAGFLDRAPALTRGIRAAVRRL